MMTKLYFLGFIENRKKISKIVQVLNKNQNCYQFNSFQSIPNIGNPSLNMTHYSRKQLFSTLKDLRGNDNSFYQVGVISSPIEDDFFAFNSEDKMDTVISLDDTDIVCNISRRSLNEYLVFTIMQELSECSITKNGKNV